MDYDVIVIGGGIMGAATAYNLSKMGKKALLVDEFKIKGAPNQSQDYSRFFKYNSHGSDIFYARLAIESLRLWKLLEKESRKRLYFKTGCLMLSKGGNGQLAARYATLRKLGLKAELLNKAELKRRFPQFNAEHALLDYGAGILSASDAVGVYLKLAKGYGLQIREGARVKKINSNSVILANGSRVGCSKIIVTAGSRINGLIKNRYPIKVTIQGVLYLKPRTLRHFLKKNFPLFAYIDEDGFYGVPVHGINAVKVSYDSEKIIDPNAIWVTLVERALKDFGRNLMASVLHTKKIMALTKECVPELAGAQVVKEKICTYDNSPDENFIIDKINEHAIVATGFSGEGFKFAPLIGKILADLATKGSTEYDISKFALSRFSKR